MYTCILCFFPVHTCGKANAIREQPDKVGLKGYLKVDLDCLSWHYQVKYVESQGSGPWKMGRRKKSWGNLCLTCSFLGLPTSLAHVPRAFEYFIIFRLQGSVSKPIKDIKQTFCKIKWPCKPSTCERPWSFGSLRLLCNFAQNILDIMSHLREAVCRSSSSIYDRTRVSLLKGFHRSAATRFAAPKKMQNIFKYLWAINTWANLLRNFPARMFAYSHGNLVVILKLFIVFSWLFRLFRF